MGILGLNKKERNIWNSIEIGSKVEFTLKNKEKYKSTVSGIDYSNIYIKTPTVGNAFLDFPQKMPVDVELEVHHPRRAKVKFISKILGQEWLKEKEKYLEATATLLKLSSEEKSNPKSAINY